MTVSSGEVATPSSPRTARTLWFASVALLSAALAALLLVQASSIVGRDAIYPVATLVALLTVALVALVREVLAARRPAPPADDIEGGRGRGVDLRPTAVAGLALLSMPVLLPTLGYLLSIAVLVLAVTLGIGRRTWLGTILCVVGVSVGAYLLFVVVLDARIPGGLVLP